MAKKIKESVQKEQPVQPEQKESTVQLDFGNIPKIQLQLFNQLVKNTNQIAQNLGETNQIFRAILKKLEKQE